MPSSDQQLESVIERCAKSELSLSTRHRAVLYKEVMDALHETGVPKTECCAKGKPLIEKRMWELDGKPEGITVEDYRISPTHWRDIGSKNGYTDQKYTRTDYKANPKPKVDEASNSTKKVKLSCSQLNEPYINALMEYRERLEQVIDLMRKHEVKKLVGDKSLCKIFLTIVNACNQNIADLAGNRQMIMRNGQPLFVQMIENHSMTNILVSSFLIEIKRQFMALRLNKKIKRSDKQSSTLLSKKAITNLARRNVRDIHNDLEFKTPEMARLVGFTGHACPRCKFYRCTVGEIDPKKNKCVVCSFTHDEPEFAVPDLIICHSCNHVLIDDEARSAKGKCPACTEAIPIQKINIER